MITLIQQILVRTECCWLTLPPGTQVTQVSVLEGEATISFLWEGLDTTGTVQEAMLQWATT